MELIGAVLGLVYLFFSIRGSLWLWPVGLLSSGFYILVFFHSKLYAEMALNFYYIAVSIYGWFHWIVGKKGSTLKHELPISKINIKQAGIYCIWFLVLYSVLFFILKEYTDSQIPGWDSLATSLSFIATWMLAKKILENWIIWIIADGLCIGIY
ncbi:MAG: nicotinamide mononucleotide transporter, partial [Bacteroidetes bacterium]|nr:nicotinamide mononucleotide transporter [Bacteroidota bacterium]